MKNKMVFGLRIVYALFLIGTGIMTIGFQWNPPAWPQSPAGDFLRAAGETGYLVGWVGMFKALTGTMILVPRTEKIAYLMALPYTVNILFWVGFVAHEWLHIGIPNFLASVILVAVHAESYRGLLDNTPKSATS